jgi:hypothetical protein
MVSYISRFLACILLALIPLQAIAASNMAICNSMQQVTMASEYTSADMPCHKHMENMTDAASDENNSNYKNVRKSHCAAMCANLAVATIPANGIKPIEYLVPTSSIGMPYQAYASITQPNLLRPPIFLS